MWFKLNMFSINGVLNGLLIWLLLEISPTSKSSGKKPMVCSHHLGDLHMVVRNGQATPVNLNSPSEKGSSFWGVHQNPVAEKHLLFSWHDPRSRGKIMIRHHIARFSQHVQTNPTAKQQMIATLRCHQRWQAGQCPNEKGGFWENQLDKFHRYVWWPAREGTLFNKWGLQPKTCDRKHEL